MQRIKIYKIISLILINAFLLPDVSRAGTMECATVVQAECLSPSLQINSPLLSETFQLGAVALENELERAGRTIPGMNLVYSDTGPVDIVGSIKNNIADGLAIALEINATPANLDPWFDGTSDEIASRLTAGFDFGRDNDAAAMARAGLAYYFSSLDEYSKNAIKLKLEQLLRNVKRSVGADKANAFRLVVLLGQDEKDPFAARKVMGYSGANTIYLHINTLLMTETEAEKETLGLMLAYQANIITDGNKTKTLTGAESEALRKLSAKKRFLTEAEKAAGARELKLRTIKKYSRYSWMSLLRSPGHIEDYLVPWTQRSRDMRKAYRNWVMLPFLSELSWLSPRRLAINFLLEPLSVTYPLRFLGYMADKAQRTIQWLQEVEKEDTEWGIAFDVVKNKPHSYRLLEFKRDGYPADEQALSVLIVNPNAGHDSTVGKDLVETFLKKGRRVFTLDWQSADPNAPEMVSDLISDVSECINHIEGRVEVAALCQGGWVSASAVALLASFHPDKVAATYMAAVPFYTTLGKNAITETVKTMPGWVFHMLVFYLGTARVQDGAHQMGGFENMGDVFQKQVGYWLQLAGSVDDEKELDRARGFVKWYYNKYLNLSLWYLEAVFAHFTYNDLYEGRYRTAVGNEMRTVDFSKIRVPLVLLEGTKDDVTAPGVLLKQELAALLEKDEGVEVEAAWRFLVEQHFISDTGEGNVNREPGKAAVIENKVLTTDIDVFLAIDHVFIDDTDPAILAKILAFLKEDGYGQCRALREAVGTERSQILEIIMNRGHIGVFTGNPRSEFRTRWNEAIDWVKLKIAENDKRKEEQAARNKQADEDRIMNGVQRITVGDAVSVLKQSMFRATSTHLIEQAI